LFLIFSAPSAMLLIVMSRQNKLMVLLVFAAFVLALTGCMFDCTAGEDDCGADYATACLCLCQTPGLVPVCGVAILPAVDAEEFVPLPTNITLRLIVASIFQPPRA
jgi:hypothetical protein